ncbi:MAG: hypothetical protein HOV80_22560 [Polyangiaceae bacterium]|nr:hypothetical protein [Polyangiaceae bacterium]
MGSVIARTATHEIALVRERGHSLVSKTALGGPLTLAREAEALEAVRGDGVVSLRRARGGAKPSLILEHVDGPTLEDRIAKKLLTPRELTVIATRLARILERIWALGWVHADLKPGNVILPGGALSNAVLVDFETARRIGETTSARATIDYAAPELLFGDQRALPSLDIFALGALLHACRTGASPFRGVSRDETMVRLLAHEPPMLDGISNALSTTIAAMLAKDPAGRLTSLTALMDAPLEEPAPPSTGSAGANGQAVLVVSPSEEPYGSIVAAVRRASGTSWMSRSKKAESRNHRLFVAELLGLPLSERERRAIGPAHADAQLLRRIRHRAFVTLLTEGAPPGAMALVSGADAASRAILEEVAAQRAGTRVVFKDAEAAGPSPPHDEPTTPDTFAARHPEELADVARRFAAADEPLRAAYYGWRASERAFEAGDLERAHALLSLAETELPRVRGRTPSLLGGLLQVSRARLGRWRGDHAGAADSAKRALSLLPSGSAAFCDALAERALSSGKLGQKLELSAVASALEAPPASDALLAWDRAAARATVQLFYAGERASAQRLVALFEKRTRLDDGSPDVRRRGLSPGVLVTAALYAGRLEDYLKRLLEAMRAFDAIGDDRGACLYGSAVGFALSQLGAYARAERVLWSVRERAESLGLSTLVAMVDHNLGEVVGHRGRLDEAIAIETRAVDALRREQDKRLFAGSLAYRARIQLARGDLEAAASDARSAVEAAADHASLDALVHGTAAEVALARADLESARLEAERAYAALRPDVPTEAGEALAELVFSRVVTASGDARKGRDVARRACTRIRKRASIIDSPALRRSFEHRVFEHVELARIAGGKR